MTKPVRTICPKCHSPYFKPWNELDRDEQIAANVRPTNFPQAQRKKHRICTRCWFEEIETSSKLT